MRSCRWHRTLLLAAGLLLPGSLARAQSAAFVATVTADSAELHKGPSEASPKLGSAANGTKFPAFGLSPDRKWVKVKDLSGPAWIARDAVSVAKAGSEAAVAPAPTPRPAGGPTNAATPPKGGPPPGGKRYGYTITRTKVLVNASPSSPTVGSANKGVVFEVGGLSPDRQFVKVRDVEGKMGWIAKGDMRPGRTGPGVIGGFGHIEREDERHTTTRTNPPPDDEPPPRHIIEPGDSGSSTTIWADGGIVLISEKVTSQEGYGYLFSGMGYGGGIRFQKHLGDGGLYVDGGFLGTANQRVQVPGSNASVFSMLYRLDADLRYRYSFSGGDEGMALWGLGGFQNYTFYFQPQSISYFYSEIYDGGTLGVGGDYGLSGGTLRPFLELDYYIPVLVGQRYGNGGNGGDGQSAKGSGYGIGLGVTKQFNGGSRLGLTYKSSFYSTSWSGQGILGSQVLHSVSVNDTFQAITLTYARGF